MLTRLLTLIMAIMFSPLSLQSADLTSKANEIKKTGKCSYEITVKIVLHSWPGKNNASDELIKEWKDGIESKWNGPSKEVIEEVAKVNGLNPGDKTTAGDLIQSFYKILPGGTKMDTHVRKLLKDEKVSSMMINCCTYKIKAVIKKGADFKGAEANQLRIDLKNDVQSQRYKDAVKGLEGLAKKDGHHHIVVVPGKHRSFVHGSQNQVGFWGEKEDGSVAAHEVGHSMKIGDHYEDDEHGHSQIKETGKNDVMGQPVGWPGTEVFAEEMLKKYGITCNCCKDNKLVDGFWQRLNRTMLAAMDAILTCNRSVLEQALKDLEDQKKVIEAALIPLSDKKPLISRLDDQVEKIKVALKECPPEIIVDSGEWCEYWVWERPVPVIPDGGQPPTQDPPTSTTPPTTPKEGPPVIVVGTPKLIITPEWDTPEDTETPPEIPPTSGPPPTMYIKVKTIVIENGKLTTKPVVNAKIKFSSLVPSLPLAGNKKNDSGHDKNPSQVTTGADGRAVLPPASDQGQSQMVPFTPSWYADMLNRITSIREAIAAPKPFANKHFIEIELPSFDSYIIKIAVDKRQQNWHKPATYLSPKTAKYVVRSWLADNILYAVLNVPEAETQK